VDRGVARSSGIKLLEWLGKVEPSPDRFLATTITLDAMKKSLGEQKAPAKKPAAKKAPAKKAPARKRA